MKLNRHVFLILFFFKQIVWANAAQDLVSYRVPSVGITLLAPVPVTVFKGENAVFTFYMTYEYAKKGNKYWTAYGDLTWQALSSTCPPFYSSYASYESGACFFQAIIPGRKLGQRMTARLAWHVEEGHHRNIYWTDTFAVTVIPHRLSLQAMPKQAATANIAFNFDIKPYITYYGENVEAGLTPVIWVSPAAQDGLQFNPATGNITGVPNRTGTYQFLIRSYNNNSVSDFQKLTIEVAANAKDKPVFKQDYSIIAAVIQQNYQLNLMYLLENTAANNNKIHFKVDTNQSQLSDWLAINPNTPSILEGIVPTDWAGKELVVQIVASSNTGGDSIPLQLRIPVLNDSQYTPTLESFALTHKVGQSVEEDLLSHVTRSDNDSVTFLIDDIKPEATWLHLENQHYLTGVIPLEAWGQQYQVTARANSLLGGNSKPATISILVEPSAEYTPRFTAESPQIRLEYSGLGFEYDFSQNTEIKPNYQEMPFVINWPKGYLHPNWLMINGTKLTAAFVPPLENNTVVLPIILHNTPGGSSKPIDIKLTLTKKD